MNSCIRYRLASLVVTATLVAGCSSGQRSSTSSEQDRAVAEGVGLTQLAVAPPVRRIWTGPEVDWEGHPSPDGRFFSMTDWSTGDVALYDFATGTKRTVTDAKTHEGSSDFSETTVISPDGMSVAFGWYAEKSDRWELRIAGLTGPDSGKTRTVYSIPGTDFVGAQAWTPDGAEVIAAVSPSVGNHQIMAINAAGRGTRVLRSMDLRYPEHMTVSPDGLWVAYDFPSGDTERDVYLMGIDGKGDKAIARYEGNDQVMGWTGSNAHLLILSERSGTPSVWALAMENGKAAGEPVLVRSNMWRARPIATSGGSRMFYSVSTGERGVYTIPIDPSTGAIGSKGISVSGDQDTNAQAFGWSADGERLAYVATGASQHNAATQDIIIKSVKRGNLRRVSPQMSRIWKLHWFHDGLAMLLVGADAKGDYGIYRMEIADGSIKRILKSKLGAGYPRAVTFSPDGKRIVFLTTDGAEVVLNELDPVVGAVSTLRRIKAATLAIGMAFSPDGRNLAIAVGNQLGKSGSLPRLIVVPVGGGPEREVYRPVLPEQFSWSGIAWTPDAGCLIFGIRSALDKQPVDDVRRLSLATGKVESTGLKGTNLMAITISRDGRALMYGLNNSGSEMWTMDAPVFGPILTKTPSEGAQSATQARK